MPYRPSLEDLQEEIYTRRVAQRRDRLVRRARLAGRPLPWHRMRWWVARITGAYIDDLETLGEDPDILDRYCEIKENTERSREVRWRMLERRSQQLRQVQQIPEIGRIPDDFRLGPDGRLYKLVRAVEWTPLTGERPIEAWRPCGVYVRYEGRTVRSSLIVRALLQPWHLDPDGRLWSESVRRHLG